MIRRAQFTMLAVVLIACRSTPPKSRATSAHSQSSPTASVQPPQQESIPLAEDTPVTEDQSSCLETLTLAAKFGVDDPRTIDALEQRGDALAQAFVAFAAFRVGQTARASRARARLATHELGVDPRAQATVQYLQLLRGAFNHCESMDQVPDAMCWPFRVEPEAAFIGLRACEGYGLSPDQVRQECVFRIASTRLGQIRSQNVKVIFQRAQSPFRGLSSSFDDFASDRYYRRLQRVDDALVAGLLQPGSLSPLAPDELERVTAPLVRRFPRLRTGLAEFAVHRAAVERLFEPFLRTGQAVPRLQAQSARARDLLDAALLNYLRAEDLPMLQTCKDLYFGLKGPQDQVAARRCLESLDPDEAEAARTFLALLYLNGQGGPRDLRKAKELLVRAQFAGFGGGSSPLLPIVNQRLEHPNAEYPEVRYCDFAGATSIDNECVSIANQLAERRDEQTLSQIALGIPFSAKPLLTRLDSQFTALAKSDSERAYLAYVDGTIRGYVGGSHRLYLRERHNRRLRDWLVEKRRPQAVSLATLRAAQQHLAKALRDAYSDHPGLIQAVWLPEHRKAVTASQRSWLAYRAAWSALLFAVQPLSDSRDREAREHALEAMLSEERAVELETDPAEHLHSFD
jgi:hypothetical protein